MFDGEDALGHIATMWGCWPSVAAGRVLGAHGAGARVAEQGQPAESGTECSKVVHSMLHASGARSVSGYS